MLIQRNVDAMEDMALQVFRRGHLPVLGEWFALPLLKHAGSKKIGDPVFDEIFHPIARELIGKCDAVLRIGGPSTGADDMVATGRRLGKRSSPLSMKCRCGRAPKVRGGIRPARGRFGRRPRTAPFRRSRDGR